MFCASASSTPQLIVGGLQPKAQEAERRFSQDHARDAQGDVYDQVAGETGQQMAEDDFAILTPERTRAVT